MVDPKILPTMDAARRAAGRKDNEVGAAFARELSQVTPAQAAVVSLYTGYMLGSFSNMQALAEHLVGGPVWTHEFANEAMCEKLRELCKPLFLRLVPPE